MSDEMPDKDLPQEPGDEQGEEPVDENATLLDYVPPRSAGIGVGQAPGEQTLRDTPTPLASIPLEEKTLPPREPLRKPAPAATRAGGPPPATEPEMAAAANAAKVAAESFSRLAGEPGDGQGGSEGIGDNETFILDRAPGMAPAGSEPAANEDLSAGIGDNETFILDRAPDRTPAPAPSSPSPPSVVVAPGLASAPDPGATLLKEPTSSGSAGSSRVPDPGATLLKDAVSSTSPSAAPVPDPGATLLKDTSAFAAAAPMAGSESTERIEARASAQEGASKAGAYSLHEGKKEQDAKKADLAGSTMHMASSAFSRKRVPYIVGVLAALAGVALVVGAMVFLRGKPALEELQVVYPYGFQGQPGPRGQQAPGALDVEYTFIGEVPCEQYSACLRYRYSKDDFNGEMVVGKGPDGRWVRTSDEGLPFRVVPRAPE